MMTDWMSLVALATLCLAALPLAHFIYRYARYSPWRSQKIGRTLMYQKIAMLVMVGLIIGARVDPTYWGRREITLVVFIALVGLFWKTDIELVQVQKAHPYDYFKRRAAKKAHPAAAKLSSMTDPSVPTPTQVTHPWKAALRTGVQTFIAFATVAVLAAPLVQDFVNEFWPDSPVVGWIALGATFVGSLSLLVSRLMAIPGVNAALTKIGLGAAPRA